MASTNPSEISATLQTFGRKLLKGMLWLLLLVAVLSTLYLFAAYNYIYSSGERAGFIQKISSKGWVCKTWEGQLAMVNLPGAATEIFSFSVRDDDVARQINDLAGKRVALDYEQHVGLPSCFGETEYFITGVREIKYQ